MPTTRAESAVGRDFVAVVFGATGFTGRFVAFELASRRLTNGSSFGKWAVCGRSEERLRKLAAEIKQRFPDAEAPGILICDLDDGAGMRQVAARCQVLLNATGPYRFYGKRVLDACVQSHTHYLDLSGEPDHIERMSAEYHSAAVAKGIAVVHAAAFDSVPCCMGVLEAKKALLEASPGCTPASAEMMLRIRTGPAGAKGHFTTYQAAVEGFGGVKDLVKLRKKLREERPQVPQIGQRPRMKTGRFGLPPWDPRVSGYLVPYFFADPSVVRLGQTLDLMLDTKVPPVALNAYIVIPSTFYLLLMAPFFFTFGILAKYSFGRRLLLAFPGFFTAGAFSHAGPTQEQIDGTSYRMSFFAKGFSQEAVKRVGGVDKLGKTPPDVSVEAHSAGCEPGYAATPVLFVACLLALIKGLPQGRIPAGVLTPDVAFADPQAGLLDILNKDGRVTFNRGQA